MDRLLIILKKSTISLDQMDVTGETILSRLSAAIIDGLEVTVFGKISECISTILQSKQLVTQHGADCLMSSMIALTSSNAPALDADHAERIHLKICSLSVTLVSLHRVKLRGRFHLLMELLKGLLNCLFIPHSGSSRGSTSYPPWFDPQKTGLSSRNGAAYSRLLLTLSSPTMSSVSGPGARSGLKDEIKKAKAYVGQFVPHLIGFYCQSLLNGRLAPDVKEKLMPGMWAAMETVEDKAWRAMSAGMDEQSRAIWNQVYGEWKRLGRQ